MESRPDGTDRGRTLERARQHFDAMDYGQAHELALAGLEHAPDDVELLRVAGRAGVEIAAPGATEQLRRVTELRPDDAASWQQLGDALAADGRTEEAAAAFAKA